MTEVIANLEAEQGVIGTVLYRNEHLEGLADVRPEHFYEPVHQVIWQTCLDVVRKGQVADPVLVSDLLAQNEALQALGGTGYLADLVDRAYPTVSRSHADVIINAYRLRAVSEVAHDLRQKALPGADAFSIIADAERTLGRMVQEAAPASNNLIDARSSVRETLAEIRHEAEHGREKGAMTGLRCIDRRMRGLRPGWLVVIAGRPSMGKTALARAAAFGAARRTKGQVVFFALEMARRELDERTLSQLSFEAGDGIAYMDMHGKLHPEELNRLDALANQVPPNFIIDDSPILSVDYVRRRVLALKRNGPVAAVFIDYLQIMDRPDAKGRNEASVIGEMTKGLKQLAREAETCVVLLSQINRGVESRDDKRPQLSDLRESGAIEQDANAVLFPYREAYYLERSAPKDDGSMKAREKIKAHDMLVAEQRLFMDVIAAKVRQGAVGSDKQLYYPEYDAIMDVPEDRA